MVRLLMQNYYMELLESDNYRVRNLLFDIQGSPECEHHIKTIPDVSDRTDSDLFLVIAFNLYTLDYNRISLDNINHIVTRHYIDSAERCGYGSIRHLLVIIATCCPENQRESTQ